MYQFLPNILLLLILCFFDILSRTKLSFLKVFTIFSSSLKSSKVYFSFFMKVKFSIFFLAFSNWEIKELLRCWINIWFFNFWFFLGFSLMPSKLLSLFLLLMYFFIFFALFSLRSIILFSILIFIFWKVNDFLTPKFPLLKFLISLNLFRSFFVLIMLFFFF